MDGALERDMVKLSNNSHLTKQACAKLSDVLGKMSVEDQQTVKRWFEHAVREQGNKLHQQKLRQ